MAHFTLQRVLDLKKRREEAMAVKLADARATVEEAKQSEATIDSMRQGGVLRRAENGPVSVGQLMNVSLVIERLDQQLDEARSAVKTAEAHERTCLTEFTVAMQERRVLDRLKERRMDEANAVEARLDQINMDAIALTRFIRADRTDMRGET